MEAFYQIIEITGVITGLIYLLLIIKENIWCWPFGILGSVITVILYLHTKLYLESLLNVYYVWAGFYGWYYWQKKTSKSLSEKDNNSMPVVEWPLRYHILNLIICSVLIIPLSIFMRSYTDSPRPWMDTTLAVLSLIATILEARKVLSAWIYWFLINGVSVLIQIDRGLRWYAILSVIYTVMSLAGYYRWRKSYLLSRSEPVG